MVQREVLTLSTIGVAIGLSVAWEMADSWRPFCLVFALMIFLSSACQR